MENVLNLLLKFGYHLLFLGLVGIGITTIVTYNNSQKEIFINTTNVATVALNGKMDEFNSYLSLKETNQRLSEQNSILLQALITKSTTLSKDTSKAELDSLPYKIIPVSICNSTYSLRNNNLTLCEGANQGISPDQGVICENGIVGIVRNVSPNYARVMSILNSQAVISCAIRRTNAHGSLVWDGKDPKVMTLQDIPKHISVKKGDTIQTSGFSTLFPKGLLVGRINYFGLDAGSNTFNIKIELFNDLATLQHAYVIINENAKEQREIEKPIAQ